MARQSNPNQSTNSSGYSDKTAYNAIRSITKQSINADIKANLMIATMFDCFASEDFICGYLEVVKTTKRLQ